MDKTPQKKVWTTLRKMDESQAESCDAGEKNIPSEQEISTEARATKLDDSEIQQKSSVDRVLVVHPMSSTYRLIRESLENFTTAEIQTSPDPIHAFEKALQEEFSLFIFGLELPPMDGVILYELICKTYAFGYQRRKLPPAVIFVKEQEGSRNHAENDLSSDARVKAILSKPLTIERLLESINGILELKDPIGNRSQSNPTN